MRNSNKILLIFLFLLVTTPIIICRYNKVVDKKAQKRNYKKQIGTYILDLSKTQLGNYRNDSNTYKNLEITFNRDYTFIMNMKVPFIYDSIGRWDAAGGGLEDWNWLYYKSWGYENYKKHSGNQFTPPWTPDSIFYINGATPQVGEQGIQEIFFKKIKR